MIILLILMIMIIPILIVHLHVILTIMIIPTPIVHLTIHILLLCVLLLLWAALEAPSIEWTAAPHPPDHICKNAEIWDLIISQV